ncbi:MAG: sel1 repeat family protein [Selenomonas ruminantium]|uniref:Sel1 repeat family protein n=1 Tax=Selenomonas ruminantium TaxID=971 RepID=A0A927ZRJ1_SELRU|nr:tetratricopeptide repeat protein [Selenomonas ruminantium]MBE6086309.1 sel1 repeat family protein [Selenomonas ruminantium]
MSKADEFMELGAQAEDNGEIQDAIKYYQAAADAGDTDGLASIGLLYQYGTGVKESFDTALEWFQKVIDAGDMDGYWLKGNAYKEIGDYESAVKCYEIAIEKGGNCKYYAIYDLAQAYHYGEGKEKSFAKALELYHQSADNGETVAMLALGDLFRQGDIVRQDNASAIYWYRKARDAGSEEAEERLNEINSN